MRKPLIALVGRPNVGKSTLFNRIIGERKAVISEIPGTTRDRLQADADWNGVQFTVVDTGGIEVYQPKGSRDLSPLAEGSIDFVPQIRGQAMIAIEEADLIIMVVDTQQGITAADEEIAIILQRTDKPVIVAANKMDNRQHYDTTLEFYGFGLGEVVGVSALHGLDSGDLLDAVVNALPDAPAVDYDEEDDDSIKVALVGRPNVGKSSLLNKLLGQERAIVSEFAGTTRDALDTQLIWYEQEITMIDTAGIRRRGKIAPGIEKYSVLRALKAIQRADVALLLIDAVEGVTAQDTHIAGMILDEHKSAVVIVNKWDLIEKDAYTMNEYMDHVRGALNFMPWVPVLFISALTGQRVHQVLETATAVYEERFHRIPTSDLNRVIRNAMARHAPPSRDVRKLKVYYVTQVKVDPPTFLFHVNDARLVHFSYERYLENSLRDVYPLTGTPIRLSFRSRGGNLEN